MTNEELLADVKQLVATELMALRTEMRAGFSQLPTRNEMYSALRELRNELIARMDDGFGAIGNIVEDHEDRLIRLESYHPPKR